MPKMCFKNIWQPIVKKIRDYNASGTIQNRDFHDIQFLLRWIECLPLKKFRFFLEIVFMDFSDLALNLCLL